MKWSSAGTTIALAKWINPQIPSHWDWWEMIFFPFYIFCKQTFICVFSFALNPWSYSLLGPDSFLQRKLVEMCLGPETQWNPVSNLLYRKQTTTETGYSVLEFRDSPFNKFTGLLKAWTSILPFPRSCVNATHVSLSTKLSLATILAAASGIHLKYTSDRIRRLLQVLRRFLLLSVSRSQEGV